MRLGYAVGGVCPGDCLVHELDPNGKQLRVVRYTDYAAETVRTLCPSVHELRARWADAGRRSEIIQMLGERGISFEELAEQSKQPEADPFDLLCHLAFNAPLRTRRERAQHLRHRRFESLVSTARHAWRFAANCARRCQRAKMAGVMVTPCADIGQVLLRQ